MSSTVFQQMSAKLVSYVLQLSTILYDAMTKIIATISPRGKVTTHES